MINTTINWDRCIHVDSDIDDELLQKLIPHILALRQKGNEPITVAINSSGGSVAVMNAIRQLVTGPSQDGDFCDMITVSVHRAYSAAATLLCLGDYAVALPNSDLLLHDVRYGGMTDVTPSRALKAAQQLQTSNETTSLRLADSMFSRWMWNYLDLNSKFADDALSYPAAAARIASGVKACRLPTDPALLFSLDGLATSIFARLSIHNEDVLLTAVNQLKKWGDVVAMASAIPKYAAGGKSPPGMLDGALALYESMNPKNIAKRFGGEAYETDFHLFLTLLVNRLSEAQGAKSLERFQEALRDFTLLQSFEDKKHTETATRLMLRHKHVFFDYNTAVNWDSFDQAAKDRIKSIATPNVRAAWLLCLLVARELLNGDHSITPIEALYLGLVDEVPGFKESQSRRQFQLELASERPSPTPTHTVRRLKKKRHEGHSRS